MTDARVTWDEARLQKLRDLAAKGLSAADLAEQLGSSRGAIYTIANKNGIPLRKLRERGKRKGSASDPSGQRRFLGIVDGDGPRIDLKPWHPALRNGSTIFPGMLIPASQAPRLLKSGKNNRKIGYIATKGRWKGMPLYTLTLEERATCPSTCREWATCYGNNLHMQPRIHPDEYFLLRLRGELAHLSAIHPEGFVIRLHVLGDFYSTEYVAFWREALAEFQALHIFGFTARQPADPIGHAVLLLMQDFEDQVLIRVSAGGKPELCSEVVDDESEATGIVCPAEKDENKCCATCGLCWTSTRTITFLRH